MKAPQLSIKQWAEDEWGYYNKEDEKKPRSERGRYGPKAVRNKLTSSEKAAANAAKRAATARGKQTAKYTDAERRAHGFVEKKRKNKQKKRMA
jgi:hypothetical protein|tara:strand:+ start:2847 stop:3125 length:279 start_codon:yes stop_codon:yes gene_type:complete